MAAPAKWKMAKLDARERASITEMEERIKDARARVGRIVSAAARDRKLVMSGRNREKLYKQIGDVYLQLDNGLKDWGKDIVSKGAIDWHDAAIRDIKGQTGEDPGNGVTKFSREYAEDVFRRVTPENGRSLAATITDNMASGDIKALRTATVDVYREGALSGMTLQDMQKAIQAKWDGIAGDRSAFRFVDWSGKPWENARYLQMLVRTTTARVARDSYFDTLTKNGDDLAVVQNADGDACDICNAWDGVILSITGSSEKYPSYQQALDAGCFHPNCRCMAERVDETIDQAELEKQAKTDTPDFEKGDDESVTDYRNRMTEEVAKYSKEFGVDGNSAKEDHNDGGNNDNTTHLQSKDAKMDADYDETRRTGAVVERLFNSVRYEDDGVAIPSAIARNSAAEIAAVCVGRKPLYHEALGDPAHLVAPSLVNNLPPSVVVDVFDEHLAVYDLKAVNRIMDSDRDFYRQPHENTRDSVRRVIRDGTCGELLGYGARSFDEENTTVVLIKDGNETIAGFVAPVKNADDFARERVLDYAAHIDRPVTYFITPGK